MDSRFDIMEFFAHPSQIAGTSNFSSPVKLRDSCDACAASKLRCPKEKPVCSRCAKKKIQCRYVATKRAGRKHEPRHNTSIASGTICSNTQRRPGAEGSGGPVADFPWPMTASTVTDDNSFFAGGNSVQPSLEHIPTSNDQSLTTSSEAYPSVLSNEDSLLLSTLTGLDTDFDALFASPISLTTHGTGTTIGDSYVDIRNDTDFFSSLTEQASPASTTESGRNETNLRDLPTFFDQASQGNSVTLDHDTDRVASRDSDALLHSCLKRALRMLGRLFPTQNEANDAGIQHPTTHAVIAANEEALSGIQEILDCPCSEDGYILVVVSLVLFKVIAWYAAAAGRQQANGVEDSTSARSSRSSSIHLEQVSRRPEIIRSYNIDGKDRDRMARQLVLGELHRVRRALSTLSERVKARTEPDGLITPANMTGDAINTSLTFSAIPFSNIMFEQLEMDLRSKLQSLSLYIVDALKYDC